MGLLDFFRPVPQLSAEEVRRFLLEHDPEQFHLLDVRQPKEYQQGHLPGALLMPVDQLRERLDELDPERTTITYCAAGPRSRAAVGILNNAGFRKVYNMAGGIRAWEGGTATGDPASQAAWFSPRRSPLEHLALAWMLEEGSRAFYAAAAEQFEDLGEINFMRQMAATEEHHKATLAAVYRDLTGELPDPAFPGALLESAGAAGFVEGGLPLDELLSWMSGKPARVIIEFAMGMEACAFDHYLLLRRHLTEEKSREIFALLAEEEQAHLRTLSQHLERFLEGN
ncbi:rhodanese-like domain-containing protein [Geoalkalibacter sp.]|uniref:rhodanese-like domain-containing protein n=1 Tax=Geoalkalibacter sp. TaxID=3041440 RepID=UPI00272E1372|nr:rhodanese-like domain-containing protein [Geoalkalibacter sp.]